MEASRESSVNEPPQRVTRWGRRYLNAAVLLAAAVSFGSLLRSRNEEGQWLAGRWTSTLDISGNFRAECELVFEPHGRVFGVNRYFVAGTESSAQTQKFAGQWTVRNGKLCVRIDRTVLRSLSHAGYQAQVAVENVVTGQNAKLVDPDYSQGTLEQLSQDRFTVKWTDPTAPDKVQTPQMWSRVP